MGKGKAAVPHTPALGRLWTRILIKFGVPICKLRIKIRIIVVFVWKKDNLTWVSLYGNADSCAVKGPLFGNSQSFKNIISINFLH